MTFLMPAGPWSGEVGDVSDAPGFPGERGSVMRAISSWWMRSNSAGRVGLTLGGLFIAGFAGMIGYILVVIASGH